MNEVLQARLDISSRRIGDLEARLQSQSAVAAQAAAASQHTLRQTEEVGQLQTALAQRLAVAEAELAESRSALNSIRVSEPHKERQEMAEELRATRERLIDTVVDHARCAAELAAARVLMAKRFVALSDGDRIQEIQAEAMRVTGEAAAAMELGAMELRMEREKLQGLQWAPERIKMLEALLEESLAERQRLSQQVEAAHSRADGAEAAAVLLQSQLENLRAAIEAGSDTASLTMEVARLQSMLTISEESLKSLRADFAAAVRAEHQGDVGDGDTSENVRDRLVLARDEATEAKRVCLNAQEDAVSLRAEMLKLRAELQKLHEAKETNTRPVPIIAGGEFLDEGSKKAEAEGGLVDKSLLKAARVCGSSASYYQQ